MHKWCETMRRLALSTYPQEEDLVGHLIVAFTVAFLPDLDDLLTLTFHNSHHGAQRILRTLYERTFTLKYIFENSSEAKRFMDYDALDWEQILAGIHTITGLALQEPGRTRLAEAAAKARIEYKQEKCSACKKPKYLGWSSLNSKDMADRVDLGHMRLHAFDMPSKLIHPSYWGLRNLISKSSPMVNTLNCAHELIVQMVLIHRRHFAQSGFTPLMGAAIIDFLGVWVFSQTSFGGILTRGQIRDRGIRIYY